jgi:hypothetical protein
MARFSGGGHTQQRIRKLLRSIEIAALVMLVGVLLIGSIAQPWLKVQNIPLPDVRQAIIIMVLVI